ncbi:hypothetical protein TIFTF001_006074 [Ficus carica]|uniref:Uncharacterized protein n=1 Tax=Ficus carica TaxID=3494 RepID=A0AA88D085_FICCA|nr:hypothetical protein TIFTF001_006074 [Ficus carica]
MRFQRDFRVILHCFRRSLATASTISPASVGWRPQCRDFSRRDLVCDGAEVVTATGENGRWAFWEF